MSIVAAMGHRGWLVVAAMGHRGSAINDRGCNSVISDRGGRALWGADAGTSLEDTLNRAEFLLRRD